MEQPKNVALTNRNAKQVHATGLLPIIQKAPLTPSQRWDTQYKSLIHANCHHSDNKKQNKMKNEKIIYRVFH